jgi:putative SOS response-associated peptidase YedK
VWAELPAPDGESVVHSCAIITCEANAMMRPIHDRMPVILDRDLEGAWLESTADEGELTQLLKPAPDDLLTSRVVSDLVNSVREDGPRLIEPREEQSALF